MTYSSMCSIAVVFCAAPLVLVAQSATPQPFVIDSVAAPNSEINVSFTPDSRTLYFVKSDSAWRHLTIYLSHREGSGWSTPTVAPFSGTWKDSDPAISPDGRQLFFMSNRPARAGDSVITGYYLWVVERQGTDGWSSPKRLDAIINRPGYNMYPSVARDGTLYFTYASAANPRVTRLYRATRTNGQYNAPELLSFSGDGDFDETVSPDQRFIVFASARGAAGPSDLFVSHRDGNRWTKPVNLGSTVNSPGVELATGLSRDLATLYFSSNRDGVLRIYQVAFPESSRSR